MYNLVLVEAGFREHTTIHRMNVITGDYLRPLCISEEKNYVYQSLELINMLKKDKPDKIIFDKTYPEGLQMYRVFMYMLTEDDELGVDNFGLITYKGD